MVKNHVTKHFSSELEKVVIRKIENHNLIKKRMFTPKEFSNIVNQNAVQKEDQNLVQKEDPNVVQKEDPNVVKEFVKPERKHNDCCMVA